MGREEDHNVATFLFWKLLKSGFDILGDSLMWRERDKRTQGL
jgi:hypothetical protein